MKILHVLAQLPSKTGSGIYFSTLVSAFAQKGHHNGLIYANQPPFEWSFSADFIHEVQFLTEALPFPIAGMSDDMPYPSTVYSQMTDEQLTAWKKAFKQALENAKAQFKPDVVICHHLFLLASLVRDVFDKVFVICHSTDIRQLQKHPHFLTHMPNMNHMLGYFTVGVQDKKALLELGITGNITFLGGGYNPSIFFLPQKKTSTKNGIRLMYCGKISHAKGVWALLKAFEQLKQHYPKLTLTLAGNATAKERRALHRFAPCKGFRVVSTQSQQALGELMRRHHIFLLPSYYEGLGLVCVEALACGLHVVATEIEGLKAVLGEKLNASGQIAYIPFPRRTDVDKPLKEDIPKFINTIVESTQKQMARVLSNQPPQDLSHCTWQNLIDRLEGEVGRACMEE